VFYRFFSDFVSLEIPGIDENSYWGRIIPLSLGPEREGKHYALFAERGPERQYRHSSPYYNNTLQIAILCSVVSFAEGILKEGQAPLPGVEKIYCFKAMLASSLFTPDERFYPNQEFVESLFVSQEGERRIHIPPGDFSVRFKLFRTEKGETAKQKTPFWNWRLEGQVEPSSSQKEGRENRSYRASEDKSSAYC